MELLRKFSIYSLYIYILVLGLIPSAFAVNQADFEEQKKESLNKPLVPLVDEKAKQPEEAKPPINNPEEIPENKQRMLMERLTNPNQKGIPLFGEPCDNPTPTTSPTSTPAR